MSLSSGRNGKTIAYDAYVYWSYDFVFEGLVYNEIESVQRLNKLFTNNQLSFHTFITSFHLPNRSKSILETSHTSMYAMEQRTGYNYSKNTHINISFWRQKWLYLLKISLKYGFALR